MKKIAGPANAIGPMPPRYSASASDGSSVHAASGMNATGYVIITSKCIAQPAAAVTVHESCAPALVTQPCHGLHDGLQDSCLEFDGTAGSTYTIDVAATDGASTCAGACAFNRYQVAVQVTRP